MTLRHNSGKKARRKTWLVCEEMPYFNRRVKCTKPKCIQNTQREMDPKNHVLLLPYKHVFLTLLYQISYFGLRLRTVCQKYQIWSTIWNWAWGPVVCVLPFPLNLSHSQLVSVSGWAHISIPLASFLLSLLFPGSREASVERREPLWSGFIVGRHVQAEDPVWRLSGRRQKPLR